MRVLRGIRGGIFFAIVVFAVLATESLVVGYELAPAIRKYVGTMHFHWSLPRNIFLYLPSRCVLPSGEASSGKCLWRLGGECTFAKLMELYCFVLQK